MWLFTKFGLFSVVKKEGQYVIRSRTRQHLVSLQKQMGSSIKIIVTHNSDYKYRIIVQKRYLYILMETIVDGIDYDNFKNSTKFNMPTRAEQDMIYAVWRAGYNLQINEEYYNGKDIQQRRQTRSIK